MSEKRSMGGADGQPNVWINQEEALELQELQRVRRIYRAARDAGIEREERGISSSTLSAQEALFLDAMEKLMEGELPSERKTPPAGDKRGPKEFLYDTEIHPLMSQVIALAAGAGIGMLFDAELEPAPGNAPGNPIHVTTMLGEPVSNESRIARAALDPRGPRILMQTMRAIALRGG